MKKQLISLLTVGSLLFSAWTALPVCAQETDNTVSIDIVHTNDMHGYAQYKADSRVGMEMLQSIIREENPDLILDAGDTFHGQVFATIEEGESIAELMDSIGYDAMTPGNHDWNYGKERLKETEKNGSRSWTSCTRHRFWRPMCSTAMVKRTSIRRSLLKRWTA